MEKKAYRYELHVHTAEASKCAVSPGADIADLYKKLGFDGIVITDHFYGGNTRVDRNQPWEDWLREFHTGYEHARKRGEEIGLTVLYAWEQSFAGIDFLTFGLDNDWLAEHPEVKTLGIVEYLKLVREAGAYVIHAHPFREASYIPYIRLLPRHVDAVEVVNAARTKFENERALDYAVSYDLAQTGGSDCHSTASTHFGGIELDHPVETMKDLVAALSKREQRIYTLDV